MRGAGARRCVYAPGAGEDDEVVAVDDLVGGPVREVGGPATGDGPQRGGAVPGQPLGERAAVVTHDLDRRLGLELPLHRAHPGGQQ